MPTINIGDRQTGRVKASTVYDCSVKEVKIINVIKKVFSDKFKRNYFIQKKDYSSNTTSFRILN